MGIYNPPAGFVSRLSRIADVGGLSVEFDQQEADDTDRPCWKFYTTQNGEKFLLTVWPHQLDGNCDAIAREIAKADNTKNGGRKARAQRIFETAAGEARSKRNARIDRIHGMADYYRDAVRAAAYGEPSVGAR